MGNKILIVEDDIDIAEMIKDYLSKDGYSLTLAENGVVALNKFKEEKYNLILLDVMMPIMDGYETLSKIREVSQVPIIMLTAKGTQMDKVIGFNKGCDDYIVKPFDLLELTLRIRAILRRGNYSASNNNLIYKDLEINKEEYKVLQNEIEVKLTKKEFEILTLLIENQGRIYSPAVIYEQIWNEEYLESDNSVLTHIRNLRDKLGDKLKEGKYIKTIWGVGYKVEKIN